MVSEEPHCGVISVVSVDKEMINYGAPGRELEMFIFCGCEPVLTHELHLLPWLCLMKTSTVPACRKE